MPIPGYLICSESGAVDETTKVASVFNIVEKLQMSQVPALPGQIMMIRSPALRITAYWLKENDDPADVDFEVQFAVILPNAPAEIELARVTFRFTEPSQRVNLVGWQLSQFFGGGILRVEARIRRVGEEGWRNRMSYPIIVERVPPLQILPIEPPPVA